MMCRLDYRLALRERSSENLAMNKRRRAHHELRKTTPTEVENA